jgi:IclR family pca regulon transcriptional regulator
LRKTFRIPKSRKTMTETIERRTRGSEKSAVPDSRSTVRSLAKGFRVLEAFTDARIEMTLSEVATETGLDPGTTYRLLTTLVELGYVRKLDDTRRFSLTLKVLNLGFNAIAHRDIRAVARPVLRGLVGKLGEAASFAVLDGVNVLYIERMRAGLVRFGVDIRIGTSIPAHISVIGQSILAFLPEPDLRTFIKASAGVEHSFLDKRSAEEILPVLEGIRARGHILADSTLTEGLRVLAVPVLGQDGSPIGAISIAVPTVCSFFQDFQTHALEEAQMAAREIATAIETGGGVGFALNTQTTIQSSKKR